MRTLTEIVAVENAEREKARAYEVAKNELARCHQQVERLSVVPHDDTMKRLRRICEDANAIPKDVIGSCGGLLPVAGEVRVFVHALAASALNNLVGKDQQRRNELATAQVALARAEERFAEFE